ncbi:MAG TPA: hypothetical protein VLH38_01295 [Patescibacteria group bacterium]|nr:hypothetical protein [Patescibacteria group bacterium]
MSGFQERYGFGVPNEQVGLTGPTAAEVVTRKAEALGVSVGEYAAGMAAVARARAERPPIQWEVASVPVGAERGVVAPMTVAHATGNMAIGQF